MIAHLLNTSVRLGKIAFLLVSASFFLSRSVYAQEQAATFSFELESQPLKDAIKEFSDTTGIDVVSRGAWLRGKSAPALSGEYTGPSALAILLSSSELKFEYTSSGTVAITDPAVGAIGNDSFGDIVELDSITVVGTEQARYVVDTSDALTGIDLDYLENPRSVKIIPEQLILDRKITDLTEALRNIPSIAFGDGFGGTNDDFFLRGFRRSAVYRNGFRRSSGGRVNLTNIAYTQVISGPASIAYGQVEPGGAVDVVTKTPLDTPRFAGELRYGSFDDFLALADWSQPINDKVAIRLVTSTQDANSFRDFTDIKRDAIALSSRIDLSESTRLEIAHEYRDESRPLDRGTIAVPTPDGLVVANDLLDIPFSRRFGDPFEEFDTEFNFTDAVLIHDFNESWSAKLGFSYQDSVANDLQSRPLGSIIVNENEIFDDEGFFTIPIAPADIQRTLFGLSGDPRRVYDEPTDRVFLLKALDGSRNREAEAFFANLLVKGEVYTGKIKHRISFGADFEKLDSSREFVNGTATNGLSVPLFNIGNPVYTLPDGFVLTGVASDIGETENSGFFLNSFTEITDRSGLLLGLRYSETDSLNVFPSLNFSRLVGSNGWVPQLGVSHKATDNLSLYASYSESFEPNAASADGPNGFEIFDPELGEQIEVGAKAKFFNSRLQTSLALYEIDKTNVIAGVNDDGSAIFVDGQSAKGVELSVTGQPIPGVNITAAYSYIDSELSTGNRPRAIPENTFNVYASYEWQEGVLNGLGIGGGAFYEGARFNGTQNVLEFDAYTLVDASIWYTILAPEFLRGSNEKGTIRFQLAFKNLTDEEYFAGGSGTSLRIPLGAPQTTVGSVSWEF